MIPTMFMRPGLIWLASFVASLVLLGGAAAGEIGLRAALPGLGAVGIVLVVLAMRQSRDDAADPVDLDSPTLAAGEPGGARLMRYLAVAEAAAAPVSGAVDERVQAAGLIEFCDVTLAAEGDGLLLDGVSLVVLPRSRVAVSGLTAAQKDAITGLLLRRVEPDAGRILLGGVDIRRIPPADLRGRLAVAVRDADSESATIRGAIAAGRPGSTSEDVAAAARAVGADAFVSELPDGYETSVAAAHAQLGSGERYLLSLARVWLADAPIVILEEPHHLIDCKAEVEQAIARVSDGRTCLLLADRRTRLPRVHAEFHLVDGRLREPDDADAVAADDDFAAALERMLAHIDRRKQSGVDRR